MYTDILTPEYMADRRMDIRKAKGRGHVGATETKRVNMVYWTLETSESGEQSDVQIGVILTKSSSSP